MSAIAALKGYRTQFLYSLHFIISNLSNDLIFRLEGEEDLDVLDANGQLLYAIQLKNLGKVLTLSDILSENRTSFIKRFLEKYSEAIPILVSYGEIGQDLKKWTQHKNTISDKEKSLVKKYKLTIEDWKLVKSKTQFTEVNEQNIALEIEEMMKRSFQLIDPIPTIGYLLNWLQTIAEKQIPITTKDFFNKIEDFATYLTERIAIHEQYGLVLRPLHKVSLESVNQGLLEREFYNATLTRYEHILLGLDVSRDKYLEQINLELKDNNVIIVKGASGQGKTTLLYSYVHRNINDWLLFELNIQQDAITSQKSIRAIAAITKKLEVPTIFVINVQPNSTEWLQIIKESSHFNHLKFLISIRNEDWYRASSIGIEFEHKEIDLTLNKEEAHIIYSRLNARNKISHFTDFEEAWIKLGNTAPLLEFVYSITQGASLKNKLKQQVQQILNEGGVTNNPQVEFLRIVSLADSLGARIDITKLDTHIDYKFIIDKLENEYLIKKSVDRKYIIGLHNIRSQTLVQILFDDFTSRKEEYGFKCISLLVEEDLYLFLLQLINLGIFIPDKFGNSLHKISVNSWGIYTSILKAFIWAGSKEYVEKNRQVMDECRAIFGGAWAMFMDFMFGGNYDRRGLLDIMQAGELSKQQSDEINTRLSSKNDVFNLASVIIDRLPMPTNSPISHFEWKSFGEALFWIKNIDNSIEHIFSFSENEFQQAFESLDSKMLSKLMLGMYYYSPEMDEIRKKNITYFIKRIKSDFDIIHLSIEGDEVNAHYIVDVLNNDGRRSTNDFAVSILDILRTALPDKKHFNSQGYGHRLQTLNGDYDDTHKTIAIENLPLEEWVRINSTIIELYEYQYRPTDWNEYCIELNNWEEMINLKAKEFNGSFNQFLKGSKTYAPLTPILQNLLFTRSEKIKQPKSITDSLGIFNVRRQNVDPKNEKEEINTTLYSKYEKFFKSVSEFKGSIESFVSQSAQTLNSRAKLLTKEDHIHDENIEYLSQTNLYDAIKKLKEFNNQYKNTFSNIDANHITKVSNKSLLTAAVFWKDFLNSNYKGDHSHTRILKLKSDFENKIIKDCKNASKNKTYSIKYKNNVETDDKPILIIDSETPFGSVVGFKEAYNIVQDAIGFPEYNSLKYLMLQLWFSETYFIQTILGRTLNNQLNEIKLYIIKDKLVEELSVVNLVLQPLGIFPNLEIDSWSSLFPDFNVIVKTSEAYSKMVLLIDHYYDLRSFSKTELEKNDEEKLVEYIQGLGLKIQDSFQTILDALFLWIQMFPFNEDVYINSEEEQEYFRALISIKDNIYPQPRGDNDSEDYQASINIDVIEEWVERLKICSISWGVFLLLLYGKYIKKHIKHNSF